MQGESCCLCMTYRQGAIAIIIYDIVTAILSLYLYWFAPFFWKLIYVIPGLISYTKGFKKCYRQMHWIWRTIMDLITFIICFVGVFLVALYFGHQMIDLVILIVFMIMNIYFDVKLYSFWNSKQPFDESVYDMNYFLSQPNVEMQIPPPPNHPSVVRDREIQSERFSQNRREIE